MPQVLSGPIDETTPKIDNGGPLKKSPKVYYYVDSNSGITLIKDKDGKVIDVHFPNWWYMIIVCIII